MFDNLFGSEPSVAKFVIAFVVVIALIALAAWLVRRFGAARLGSGGTRGRQPRLAVIDAASVDGRRRLVLIRRDNIEHLLMIGGPTDIVVEPNIVRASARDSTRETGRTQPADIVTPWPLQPTAEPAAAATPARHLRATFGEETHWHGNGAPQATPAADEPREPARVHPEARMEARTEARTEAPAGRTGGAAAGAVSGLAADLSARFTQPEPSFGRHAPPEPPMAPPAPLQAAPSVEPVRRHPPEPEFDSRRSDRNLAEMASRLEAALRRPPSPPDGRPPVTDALAFTARPKAPEVKAPEVKAAEVKPPEVKAPEVKAPEVKLHEVKAPPVRGAEAKVAEVKMPEAKAPETRLPEVKAPEIKAPAAKMPETKALETKTPAPKAPVAKTPTIKEPAAKEPASKPAPKSIYDNLEQEMASLLGRPANK